MTTERLLTAADHARALLAADCYVLDTETTGLGPEARVIEVALIDAAGAVLLNTLINPGIPSPPEATAVHGLTDADVADAPPMADVWPRLMWTLSGRQVVSYNADFDARLLAQSMPEGAAPLGAEWTCAMVLWFALRGLRRWASLDAACHVAGVTMGEPRHRALGDARSALALMRVIAGE